VIISAAKPNEIKPITISMTMQILSKRNLQVVLFVNASEQN